MARRIEESELILNGDGSIFHLHLKPGELADNIILVGDPGRVETVTSFFDTVELVRKNREFVSATGIYKGTRFSVIATGIGTDNIDIVVNELDALVNIDFETRTVHKEHKALRMVRIGTSGSLQKDLPVDSCLLSSKAIGFDGLLNFYAGRNEVADLDFEQQFKESMAWNPLLASPYVVDASKELLDKLSVNGFHQGVTISAPGFYGPQGRMLRLGIQDVDINEKISTFKYEQYKITNYEMECSAIYGLSKLLGHQAATVCAIIANRQAGEYSKDYKPVIKHLIEKVLDSLV
ncbi:nucleoside phosphorylase [Saccharicrinis fermentans]|uniref:Uridine phosphorylase n=1 Tax=Saccharicrinis fermentans DSM 9555 = JCM 21142 TaxID=869213 RepID=W7YI67_9BACT|nr:nucleoside phosphorylase [Saccharicrinis fermentans]GAF02249.1 uridine phosphorylase [Saccharicrinis fermentans DSM 9555 = JCM 21142]